MFETQEIVCISQNDLRTQVGRLSAEGYRLVQISCTEEQDHFLIDYAFDKDYRFLSLRVETASTSPVLPSISPIYFAAFLYENELHDLFGITFDGLVLDYGGKFYRIDAQTPFRTDNTEVIINKD